MAAVAQAREGWEGGMGGVKESLKKVFSIHPPSDAD